MDIVPVGIKGNSFVVKINGHEYGYGEKPQGLKLKELADKFGKILKFSAGRALAWLKKNSDLVSGTKKNESEDLELIGFNMSLYEAEEKKASEENTEEKKKEHKPKKFKEESEEETEEETEEVGPEEALDWFKDYLKMGKKLHRIEDDEMIELEKIQRYIEEFIKDRKALGRKLK